MCYTGTAKASKKVRIAKKNIKVFKFGVFKNDGKVHPYFMHNSDITYQEGNEYNAKIVSEFGTSGGKSAIIVNEGLHSFADSRAYVACLGYLNQQKYGDLEFKINDISTPDNEGIMMASVHYRLFPFSSPYNFWDSKHDILVLIKCHIPKGTKYIMDWYGHTVSESLVVDEIIKLKQTK